MCFIFKNKTTISFCLISELIGTDISSGVVQTLIVILAKVAPKECKKFCKVIVNDCLLSKDEKAPNEEPQNEGEEVAIPKKDLVTTEEEENGSSLPDPDIPEPFLYQAVCRTLEVILSQAEVIPKLYRKLCKKLFSGKLVKLAQHELANYTVQKLLSTCPEKELVSYEITPSCTVFDINFLFPFLV